MNDPARNGGADSIFCGELEMSWDTVSPVGARGSFRADLGRHMIYVWKDGGGEWRSGLWVFRGWIGPQAGYDSPERAAQKLSVFLRELSRSLDIFHA